MMYTGLLLALVSVQFGQATVRGDDLFPLGVYWPHSYADDFARNEGTETWAYVDRILGELKKNHCNFIWACSIDTQDAKRLCELADKHGIKVGLLPEAVHHPMNTRQAATPRAVSKAAEETFKTFGQVKGVWGYVLDDEPPIAALPYLEALETELLRLDPTRPITTVFRRTEAVPAIQHHQFGIVTYDCYPFGHARDPNLPNTPASSRQFYRGVTELLGRQCEKRGVTFWVMPGAFQEIWGNWYWSKKMTVVAEPGAYLHWRMPTVGETRWQIWEGIAGGAKGVIFYTLWPERNFRRTSPDSPRDREQEARARSEEAGPKIDRILDTGQPGGLLNVNSTPTRQLVAMGEAYKEVERLAGVLRKLRFSNIPVVFSAGPFRTQTFRDGQGNLYAMVVNDDTDKPVTSSVIVLSGIQAVHDLRKGKKLKLAAGPRKGLQSTTVSLEAGGGTLLQLQAAAASRPLAKLIEDFSTPSLAVELERAEVRIVPTDWNAGWKHEVVPSKDTGNKPGTVTCAVLHKWSLEPSGPMFVVYQGDGNVRISFSTDGEYFSAAKDQGLSIPIPIPKGTKHVRFTLLNADSSLAAFCIIATETN